MWLFSLGYPPGNIKLCDDKLLWCIKRNNNNKKTILLK